MRMPLFAVNTNDGNIYYINPLDVSFATVFPDRVFLAIRGTAERLLLKGDMGDGIVEAIRMMNENFVNAYSGENNTKEKVSLYINTLHISSMRAVKNGDTLETFMIYFLSESQKPMIITDVKQAKIMIRNLGLEQ